MADQSAAVAGAVSARVGDADIPGAREASTWQRADVVVAVAVVVALIVRTIAAWRGTWLDDDWILLERVSDETFGAGTPFTLYNGHFLPVLVSLFRGVSVVAPGSHVFAATFAELLGALAAVLVYLVLRRVFGPRPLVVVLVVWYAFTPLNLVHSMWPVVSYYIVPFEIALATALLLLFRYLDHPTAGRRVAVVAAVLIAFLTFEKAIVIPFFLLALTAWFPIASATPLGLRRALREHRVLWQMLGCLLGAFFVVYFALSATQAGQSLSGFDFSLDALARLTGNMVFVAFGTSVFGGPWSWSTGSVDAIADPPQLLVLLTVAGLVALIAWTCLHRRFAWRGWVLLTFWLAFDVAGLAFARLGEHGPGLGRAHRFVADVAIPAALMIAFALLPTRAEAAEGQGPARTPSAVVTTAIGVALVASMLLSYGPALDAWASNPAKPYVENARDDFDRASDVGMLEQVVPTGVLRQIFFPDNTTRVVMSPYPDHPDFRPTVERLLFFDRLGRIKPAQVGGWLARPGSDGDCGVEVTAPGRAVRLKGSPFRFGWYVHLSYYASEPLSADVALGGKTQHVPFREGTHDVFFPLVGGGSSLDFSDIPPGARLCITGATVGALHAATD